MAASAGGQNGRSSACRKAGDGAGAAVTPVKGPHCIAEVGTVRWWRSSRWLGPMRRLRARHDRAADDQARPPSGTARGAGSVDKIDKFDLKPIMEAYDIELPAGDDEAAEVFVAVAHRVHEKYCTVGRAHAGGAETIQMLPVSSAAPEA
jgi:hypothetical protein